MANTEWYDKNHSNDPTAEQGRDGKGRFTTDTIGGSGEQKESSLSPSSNDESMVFSDAGNSFLQSRAKEVGYQKSKSEKDLKRIELSENIIKSFLKKKPKVFDEPAMIKEYDEFLESGKVPDSLKEDCRRAFSRGGAVHKWLLLKTIKDGEFKYEDTTGGEETSCCCIETDKSLNKIRFNKSKSDDFDTTFWHEHWHAIDIFTFKQPFANEFKEDGYFVRRNAEKMLESANDLRAKFFKEKTGYDLDYAAQNRNAVQNKVNQYKTQFAGKLPEQMGPFAQLKYLKESGIQLDDEAEGYLKGFDFVQNSTGYHKDMPSFSAIGDMLQAATGKKNNLGGHKDGYFDNNVNWRAEFVAEFGAALALKDNHNKATYNVFKQMFKNATKRMKEVFG